MKIADSEPQYVVWRRRSTRPHLDGYVSATSGRPSDDTMCQFEVLLVTGDWGLAHHRIATERHGNDVFAHRAAGCPVCWKADGAAPTG